MSETTDSSPEGLQRRLEEAEAALARYQEAAGRTNRARSQRLAEAIHDLRQPMHAIGLFMSGLRPHVTAPEGGPILDKIEAALAALEGQVSALLEWSRLDAGLVSPRRERVSVHRLLGRLLDAFEAEAAAKGLSLRVHPLPVLVESDPLLLERMLRILAAAALRHTDRGGVLIGARRRGGHVRFQFWDTGSGGDAEAIGHVFQGLETVHESCHPRTRKDHLGLATAGLLGRLLAHPLKVHATPGKGSMISVDVPLAGPEAGFPEAL